MVDTKIETSTQPRVKFNEQGLIPAIVQDAASGQVLMMAWMNDEALRHTLETRQATFYSRSRGKIWVKGESSGHVQRVMEVRLDCDQDTVLLRVEAAGPACHAGYQTCFYRAFEGSGELTFMEPRVFEPDQVYRA
jgi:phosphoribosyl-AMP cyclohydrolase